jgi:hypothetical protein
MTVSLFLMLRISLVTSHCIGSFQWPRRGGGLLRTNIISLCYLFSAHVYSPLWETTYLSEHNSLQEFHITHIFVPTELFFVNDYLPGNATGNWPKYSQRPFGHSAINSPMWSPDSLSMICASVRGGSSLVVRKSGHKQFGPRNFCFLRSSGQRSGGTRMLPSTGLPSSFSFNPVNTTTILTRRMA